LYFLHCGARKTAAADAFPQDVPEISGRDTAARRLFYVTPDAGRWAARIAAAEPKDGTSKTPGEFPVPSIEHWQPAITASPDGRSVIAARTDRDDATQMGVDLP
jgi:hypothetical protein